MFYWIVSVYKFISNPDSNSNLRHLAFSKKDISSAFCSEVLGTGSCYMIPDFFKTFFKSTLPNSVP